MNYGQINERACGTMVEQAAQRPSPAASGTLAKTPLLHLLVYALDKKLAGTIDIVSPDDRAASVLFVGGDCSPFPA